MSQKLDENPDNINELSVPGSGAEAAPEKSDGGDAETVVDTHIRAQTLFLGSLRWVVVCGAIGLVVYTAVAIWIVFSTFSMTFEGSVGIDKLPADENGDIKEEIKSALGGWFEYKSFIVIAAFSSITVIVSSVFLGIKGMLSLLIKEGSKQGNENSTA